VAERLSVDHLEKVFPAGSHAVKDVSFSVDPGTFLVLLGPSGSGKTTLLRTIAGIERVSSGGITIGDTLVADERTHVPPERRDLSMVFQDYALWPHLSVADNVGFALKRHRHGRGECRRLALVMIERVGLGHLADRYPGQLSGGEQQRVALARALAGDTGLLLCDEPLSNLDADLRERMRIEISSLVREVGATTIYITHDQQEAFALADQVGVLEHGELVQLGTPEEVYASPATRFVARFTGLAGEMRVRPAGGPSLLGTVLVEPQRSNCSRPIEAFLSDAAKATLPGAGSSEYMLTIRPGAVSICGPADGHLRGHITDVAFRGRDYELAVDLQGGGRLTGIHSERRMDRGASVGLSLDPSGSVVFPLDPNDHDQIDPAEERPMEIPA
jgi:ABC-type Fe3+/spermidine/putrescine transport system ATPase subunit